MRPYERERPVVTADLVLQLVAAFGVGPDTAVELLIVVGVNINWLCSEAA
jgi:hypothetical protein